MYRVGDCDAQPAVRYLVVGGPAGLGAACWPGRGAVHMLSGMAELQLAASQSDHPTVAIIRSPPAEHHQRLMTFSLIYRDIPLVVVAEPDRDVSTIQCINAFVTNARSAEWTVHRAASVALMVSAAGMIWPCVRHRDPVVRAFTMECARASGVDGLTTLAMRIGVTLRTVERHLRGVGWTTAARLRAMVLGIRVEWLLRQRNYSIKQAAHTLG